MRDEEKGQALIPVLGLLGVLTVVAWAFVSWMNTEQRLAGDAYRRTAALYLAEGGMEKAVWYLTHQAPDGSGGGTWRPVNYEEVLGAGRFVIEEIKEDPASVLAITVRGETATVVRRIRRVVRIAPRALGFGLFGGDVVFAGNARTYVVPHYDRHIRQRLGDAGAFGEVWFERSVQFNDLDGQTVQLRDGPAPDYALFEILNWPVPSDHLREVLADLVLVGEAGLIVGNKEWPLRELSGLAIEAPGVHARALRRDAEVSMPSVDLEIYRGLARENAANAALNETVGERALDRILSKKRDSLYTQEQFERILGYFEGRRREGVEPRLTGLVFVEGMVRITQELRIEEGALVVYGSLNVTEKARLEVRHGLISAALPGVVVSGDGGMIRLGRDSVLIADGLVFASIGIEVSSARMDVKGAVLARQGFLNDNGLVIIRYAPDVLRAAGVSRTDHVLLRPLSWQELP